MNAAARAAARAWASPSPRCARRDHQVNQSANEYVAHCVAARSALSRDMVHQGVRRGVERREELVVRCWSSSPGLPDSMTSAGRCRSRFLYPRANRPLIAVKSGHRVRRILATPSWRIRPGNSTIPVRVVGGAIMCVVWDPNPRGTGVELPQGCANNNQHSWTEVKVNGSIRYARWRRVCD